jgi:diketogulonate reductase-like aldo/keto reductase
MTRCPHPVPDFLYGTAWKENRTAALTELALRTGFRAIDTANQRKHYHEAGVGEAWPPPIAPAL